MPQLFVMLNTAHIVDQEVLKEEFEDNQLFEDTEIGMEEGGVQKSIDRY